MASGPAPAETADRRDLALEQTLGQHLPALYRTIRHRVGHDDDAAEIVQEACLRLLRYRDSLDPAALRALLYRIALNLVASRARTLAQRGGHELSLDQMIGEQGLPPRLQAPTQEQQFIDGQRLDAALAAIQGLSARCRQVFLLNRFHDMSYRQIAAHCGISEKMVEKHISKALAAVRTRLGGELP